MTLNVLSEAVTLNVEALAGMVALAATTANTAATAARMIFLIALTSNLADTRCGWYSRFLRMWDGRQGLI